MGPVEYLLAGEVIEGECDPDCPNYHSEGPDLQAKETNRGELNASQNGGQNDK